jgi:hypothetical protein
MGCDGAKWGDIGRNGAVWDGWGCDGAGWGRNMEIKKH